MKNLKTIAVAALVALGAGSASAASCTSSFSLSALGPPGVGVLGNSFKSTGNFNDCYSFSLNAPAVALGVTLEYDWLNKLDIGISSIALSGGTLASTVASTLWNVIPGGNVFSFSGLGAGSYTLEVAGNVGTQRGWSTDPVGYKGAIVTAPVPEPETYAMLALGLGAAVVAARRRKSI